MSKYLSKEEIYRPLAAFVLAYHPALPGGQKVKDVSFHTTTASNAALKTIKPAASVRLELDNTIWDRNTQFEELELELDIEYIRDQSHWTTAGISPPPFYTRFHNRTDPDEFPGPGQGPEDDLTEKVLTTFVGGLLKVVEPCCMASKLVSLQKSGALSDGLAKVLSKLKVDVEPATGQGNTNGDVILIFLHRGVKICACYIEVKVVGLATSGCSKNLEEVAGRGMM
ncbi:hypothetical protein FA15DRAFT_662009 [Coprinopsis marcescibilis]|uniref:Uncharacterized protein n=1 Tax=Coprinopsis marcescibilis TaxID=230819 RepID=A0A5C3K9A5_COPMA|nr:hypothetical protein FA15DRAFT_662009 [Coprinopsis marcescibilis]